MTQAALSGLRVLDLCNHRGEMAGRVLADLGAEVICIEPPGGSESRNRDPFTSDGRSLWWATFALGKKSVVVDFDQTSDRAAFLSLVATADICIESFSPGYLKNLGLSYDVLASHNPRLIMASITPFGQDGPRAGEAATDLTLESVGGLVGLQGDPDRPPIPVGFPQAAMHAGVQAAADLLIAINARELTGEGQHLDVSTQSAVVWTLMNATGWPSVVGVNPPGFCDTRHLPRAMPIEGMRAPRLFECADGHATFGVHLPGVGERTMAGAIDWLGRDHPDLLDEEIASVDWARWMNLLAEGKVTVDAYNRAFDAVAEAFKRCRKKDLLNLAVEEKLLIAPVLNAADLFEDEHLASRGFFQAVDDLMFAGPFAQLSKTPIRYRRAAPELASDQAMLNPSTPSPTEQMFTKPTTKERRAWSGLKVADFAWVGVGPIISKSFADHGAEVIHVESSQRLDVLRTIGPFKDREPGVNRSQFFNNFNTNKQSIDLDFKDPDDLAIAKEIANWADVLVESFVPGTMARYGLDYANLKQTNPDLIMMSTCMRGQTGPHKTYGGFGNQGAALAGLFSVTGWPDREPIGPWGAYTDFIAPRFGVAALNAALFHRRNTGEGQYIDLSQIEAGIHFMGPLIPAQHKADLLVENPGMASLYHYPHGVYAASEESSFIAIDIADDAQWRAFHHVTQIGEADWNVEARRSHADEIEAAIKDWVSSQSAASTEALLQANQIPAHEVLWPSRLYEDPQLAHRSFFQLLDHPETGPVHYDGHVTQFSATPPMLATAGPTLGQHNAALRARFGSG